MPAERQGAALATVFAGMTLATVIGVPLATWLGGIIGWPVVAMIGMLALAAAALVAVTLPSGTRGQRTTTAALVGIATDRILAPAIAVTFFQMAAQFATYAVIGAYLTEWQGMPPAPGSARLAVPLA